MLSRCARTDAVPPCSPLSAIKEDPSHENGGYRSFDIVVYNLILFYHGYIWDSIEIIINVSHLTLKNIAKAGLFLCHAQFCIIIPAVNED